MSSAASSVRSSAHAPGKAAAGSRRRSPMAIIVVAAYAAFLATFNETVLNVAFAPIMADFGIGMSTVQWLATAYMLGVAVMIPISAFAYRSIPTRTLFVGTCAVLVVGSIVGGTSQNFAWLLAGRVIQAIGSGMLIPVGMNITIEVAPRERLGACMGVMAAMTTVGVSASIIVSGAMLAVLEWHALLWMFAVLAFVCLVCGAVLLGDIAKLSHPSLDAPSVAMVALALVGILYGISTAFSGSALAAGCSFVAGCAFLALFIRRQAKLEEPLINVGVLRTAPFALGVLANMLALVAVFSMTIIVPTFLQSAAGVSSLGASLTMFPAVLLGCVASALAGRMYDSFGIKALLPTGFVLICVFSAVFALLIGQVDMLGRMLLFAPVSIGAMIIVGPVQSFGLSHLTERDNAHGVTVMTVGFQIAGCIGSSLFTGVYSLGSAAGAAAGGDALASCSTGFLCSGLLTALFALVGLCVALRLVRIEKRDAQARAAAAPHGSGANGALVEGFAGAGASALEPTLSQVMERNVFSLSESDSVAYALSLFVRKGVSGAPVVDGRGRLKGFLSDGDVMRYLRKQEPAFKNAYSFVVERENNDMAGKIERLMSLPVSALGAKSVVCVDEGASLGEVCKVLADKRLKKVPVVRDGRMVGIVNRSSITRFSVNAYLAAHDQG